MTSLRLSRRQMLAQITAGGGLLLALGAARAWQQGAAGEADARALLGRQPSFDLHCHPGLFVLKDIPNSLNVRRYFGDDAVAARIRQMLDGRMWGGSFAFVSDAPLLRPTPKGPRPMRDYGPGEAWAEYKRQYAVLGRLLDPLPATQIRNPGDLAKAHEAGRVGALYACEGADHLEGRLDRVAVLHGDGVRQVQLVHYRDNRFADVKRRFGQLDRGLTPDGRDLVAALNRQRIIVDVSHASEAATLGVAAHTAAPIVSSHALLPMPGAEQSLTSPAQARAVAATGGVIGAFPGALNRNLEGYVDSIFRLIDLVGLDHVGLGTDMDGNIRPVWDDYGRLPVLTAKLLARGLWEAEVGQLIGGNALRVMRAVIG